MQASPAGTWCGSWCCTAIRSGPVSATPPPGEAKTPSATSPRCQVRAKLPRPLCDLPMICPAPRRRRPPAGVEVIDGCDLFVPGSFDAAFAGCAGVFHVAAVRPPQLLQRLSQSARERERETHTLARRAMGHARRAAPCCNCLPTLATACRCSATRPPRAPSRTHPVWACLRMVASGGLFKVVPICSESGACCCL